MYTKFLAKVLTILTLMSLTTFLYVIYSNTKPGFLMSAGLYGVNYVVYM